MALLTTGSVYDKAADVKSRLVSLLDDLSPMSTALTGGSLGTVMGAARPYGLAGEEERLQLLRRDASLTTALQGCHDMAEVELRVSQLISDCVETRLDAVLRRITAQLNHLHNYSLLPMHQKVQSEIKMTMISIQELATSLGKMDAAYPQERQQAIKKFKASVEVIANCVEGVRELNEQLEQVNQQLNSAFDSTDLLATANDANRARLNELAKQIENQRRFAEQRMLQTFDDAAKARPGDSRPQTTTLIIPDDLVKKGLGKELMTNALHYLHSNTSQSYSLIVHAERMAYDYNPVEGTHYQPPTKQTAYVDVDPRMRDGFSIQNKVLAQVIIRIMGESGLVSVFSTYKHGNRGQYEAKAHKEDGLSIIFGLISLNRPSASQYRDQLESKIHAGPDHMHQGDPSKKVAVLRDALVEAKALGVKIKWSVGRRIITILSGRNPIFANKLYPLVDSAPNQDDSADQHDELYAAIEQACNEIREVHGNQWYNTQAHEAYDHLRGGKGKGKGGKTSKGKGKGKSSTVEWKCKFGKNCKYKDTCSGTHDHDGWAHSPVKGKGMCQGKTCNDKSVYNRMLCETCHRKAKGDGYLYLKDGTKKIFKKAQRALSKKKAEDSEGTDDGFNSKQLAILKTAFSAQQQPACDGDMNSGLFQALSACTPNGPKKRKTNVMERLGESVSKEIQKQAHMIMSQDDE